MADTATFKMQKSMNLMRNVLLEIGVALLPALVEVLDKAVLPALTAFAGWMSDHSDEMAAGVIAVVDAAVELGSATKTAVNDAIAAYTRFITWGENNVDRAKTFWQDTTTEALALKTAVNTDVLAAYGELVTWGTDNKAKLEQLWTDTASAASDVKTTINDEVVPAYEGVSEWTTTNAETVKGFWTDTASAASDVKTTINDEVVPAYEGVSEWTTTNAETVKGFWTDTASAASDVKTTINDEVVPAYEGVSEWTTTNAETVKGFWTDTASAASDVKTTINDEVVPAYEGVSEWTTTNAETVKGFWTDTASAASDVKTTINDEVVPAYEGVSEWTTTNAETVKGFWKDTETAVADLGTAIDTKVAVPLVAVSTWHTNNKAAILGVWDEANTKVSNLSASISALGNIEVKFPELEIPELKAPELFVPKLELPQPSLPRLPGLPFAKDEPMLPASADTETVVKEIDEALGQVEERLGNINDDWLTMAALVVTLGGLLLGGPFGWIGAGIGATRLLKNFLPDIRAWLAENNAAIAKKLDPLLWSLQESLGAAWGEGLPEVPPEVLQKAPEDRNWLFQWWIDHGDEFYGAADAIAKGIRNVTEALKNAKLDWTNFWPLNLMEAAAKATLEAIWAIAWLIDRSDELFQETPPQHQIELDVRRALTGADLPYTGLGPIAPPGFLEAMPDDSALGSLATALGSSGGGRTIVFNVENLYGVDDLEDFVQEANLAALRRGQENVLD